MPGGDRTGPVGLGPMTGRAAGYCAGSNLPAFASFFPRRVATNYGGRMVPPPALMYGRQMPYGIMQPRFFAGFGWGRGNRWLGW